MQKRRKAKLPLSQCWLYAIASPVDLVKRLTTPGLKYTEEQLRALARDAENYRLFKLTDDKGKAREIQWPKRRLQALHARVHTLLSRVEAPDYLYSAIKGRSYIDNAAAHDPAVRTIKVDVKKFFPSVSWVFIFNFFTGPLKCRRDVAGLMADILTFDRHLATGSAASPIMAYYSFKPMFDEIDAFAKSKALVMTCYVDDMALSGPEATKGALHVVTKIITKHGLKSHKTHAFAASQPKVVTGVCNTVAGAKVPNKLHLKIKNGFEQLARADTVVEQQKVLSPLLGRLEAAGQIDVAFKDRAKTLRAIHRARPANN